ncbi:hypothetical protein [Luteitalea sp. TBR-22]|uniref:hypothetical protein n=1 Tax=Luteitalea sp. TBR-22 TaxID=2802971 RepID=UPI001EF5B6C2|nr:hypothetical protein [Luteitalea sp. TBR-22]
MRLTCPRLTALLCALTLGGGVSVAAAPLDASRLDPSGSGPREGRPFSYQLTLVAASDTTADVEVHIPSGALLVEATGASGVVLDADARLLRWQARVPGGAPVVVRLTFLAGLDAGGHTQTTRVTLRPWQGEPTYLAHQAEVESLPTSPALTLGGIGVTPAGVAVLAWLGVMGLMWAVLSVARPRAAAWATIAVMVPAGFLAYFVALAREDRRIGALPPTTCVVTDRVLDSRTGSSSTSRASGQTTVYAPRLGLSWTDGHARHVAQGFGTDSRLSRGSAATAEAVLTRYALGASVPCAIDDRDARRAYVERGYGGAYFFALIPLPLLLLGVWGLTRERTHRW